jgi:hypothetical protein
MKKIIALMVIFSFSSLACYNTYYISRDELKKIQSSEETSVTVKSVTNESIQVKEDSRLFVRSLGGKKYQITPFNFKLTESQVVASDRDYILMLDELKENGEVENVSTWKTAGLITLGLGAVTGLIMAFILTQGQKTKE